MKKNKSAPLPVKSVSSEKSLSVLETELTGNQKQLLTKHRDKVNSRHRAPKLKVEHKPGNTTAISAAGKNEDEKTISAVALMDAFGTTSQEFQSYMMRELIDASCSGGKTAAYDENDMNGVLAAMHGINPDDEIEGMLASQMIAVHYAAMKAMRRLKNSDTVPAQDSNGNIAIKLLRTYTAQLEALNRYRGKGQQKMTVEHVHVHAGGQAIVGQVSRPEGEGLIAKTEE